MLVFRDGRQATSGVALVSDVMAAARDVERAGAVSRDRVVSALLHCGELECALADAGSADAIRVAQITDSFADQLLGRSPRLSTAEVLRRLSEISVPSEILISPYEGFAY